MKYALIALLSIFAVGLSSCQTSSCSHRHHPRQGKVMHGKHHHKHHRAAKRGKHKHHRVGKPGRITVTK